MSKKILLSAVVVFFLSSNMWAQEKYKADWESLKKYQVPEWFLDAKFGIYFHWGVYSYMGQGEWYSHHMYEDKDKGKDHELREYHVGTYGDTVDYYDFIPKFTAEHFDPDEWAQLFKESGARFVGPVAEHCDNFSNWDSKVNKYNSVNYGPKRDIVGEMGKAIKAKGMKFVATLHHSWEWGWYPLWTGLADTTNHEFRELFGEETLPETFDRIGHDESGKYTGEVHPNDHPSRKFVDVWKKKIYEVVDQYEPDMLWFDGRVYLIPEKDRQEMLQYYYNKALDWGKEVVLTYKNQDLPKGVAVFDIERGRMEDKTDFPWLTDDSFAWNSWAWRSKLDLKAPNVIIHELADICSKNGCLLLNIAPTHDGIIPEDQRKGLLEIGKWLKVNGEAIYETRPYAIFGEGDTKLKKGRFGGVQGQGITYTDTDFRFTTNSNKLYIIQLGLPKPGKEYQIRSLGKSSETGNLKIKDIKVLGSDEKIGWKNLNHGLTITAPKVLPNDKAIVYKLIL